MSVSCCAQAVSQSCCITKIVKDQVIVEVRERAVVSTVKESDICSGREIYHIGRIEFGPVGYTVAVVFQSRGRKATKKCVE